LVGVAGKRWKYLVASKTGHSTCPKPPPITF
jgi:hypothetical protein